MSSHIQDKGQVMVLYCGLYANARRGKMRKADAVRFGPSLLRLSSLWQLRNNQNIYDILIL
ncbi:MAG: hypothetical protein ACQES8_07875 [Thermodesulfobacteriota bacterium]